MYAIRSYYVMQDEKYKLAFSVEEVNNLVLKGVPFRDAYKLVGAQIENGEFEADLNINHTHEGSIGNLCTDRIKHKMDAVISGFGFDKVESALSELTK